MSTFAPQDLINVATALNHKAPSSTMQVYAVNLVNARVWTRYPWDWTLQTMTQISLIDGQQDYSLGGSDLAAFYRFKKLELQLTSTTPTRSQRLNQKNDLSVELVSKGGIDTIRFFSWEMPEAKLRLDYAAAVPSGTTLALNGKFQKIPTAITSSNLTTTLVAPDHYFNVLLEGVRWKFYELTDDPRAGNTQETTNNKAGRTGQYAIFMDALDDMARAEDLSDGEDTLFPGGGTLATGRENQWPRVYGQ